MFRGVNRSKDIGSQEELHEAGLDRNLKTGIVKKMNKYVAYLNNAMANESSEDSGAKSNINLEINEVKDFIKKLSTTHRIKQMQKKQSSGLDGIEQVSSEDEETVISIY
jgi:hypothetical protein